QHFQWADVLVLLSRYEGSPLTILEAQRQGCVPIVTNVGAVDELILDRETGFLIESIEDTKILVNQVATRMGQLYKDRKTLCKVARQAATARVGTTWSA